MLKADQISLRDWLRHATEKLERAGLSSPRHDAERIAAHALRVSWSDIWTRIDEPVEDYELDALLERRVLGEPLGYIEGTVVFYGLELACGPGVLVPRPETEVLVDVALELIEAIERPVVVDIGCGTGAIALAIGAQRPGAELWATDISEDALAYARRNAYMWHADVRFVRGDLLSGLPSEIKGRVDLIVSNPPYIASGTLLPPDVRAEPDVALIAEPRGDEVLRRIVEESREWLAPNGAIALEIGDGSQASVLGGAEVRNDLTGRPRVVWARS